MNIWKNATPIIAMLLFTVSPISYAAQPLNEAHLADTTGDESPIRLDETLTNTSPSTHQQNFEIPSEALSHIEKQLNQYNQAQALSPLLYSIDQSSRNINTQDNERITNLHYTATQNFGLEPFSMAWNGNLHLIADLDKISNVSFNHESGQYELNNVQGRVWTEVSLH